MVDMQRDQVRRIVRQVLAEEGVKIVPARPKRAQGAGGARTLIVFHAGVRKLDAALEQVQRIEADSARCSVFTGQAARAWVCGEDVKERTGARCILDSVSADGVEKVLTRADILVLPTLCLQVASKVVHLLCDDLESRIVFTALLQGKKILAARDGFMFCDLLVNDALREEIEQVLGKLQRLGVLLCPTEELHAAFRRLVLPETASAETTAGDVEPAPRLVTGRHVMAAVDTGRDRLRIHKGAIVTALARDLIKEYGLRLVEEE